MARERVTLNVGGKRFQTFRNTLKKWPDTLLSDLDDKSIFWEEELGEYFFDRDPKMFSVILNFYRFAEVHLPHNVCGPAMRRELEFWGIQDKSIAPCCWKSYNSYQDQERCISMIEEAFGSSTTSEIAQNEAITAGSKTKRNMNKIYTFLEEPNSSKGAKTFSWIFGVLLIATVMSTILSSQSAFRVDSDNDEEQYANETNPKKLLLKTTEPHVSLVVLDVGLLCFFTIELIVRFVACPAKLRFFKSFFNIVDIIAVLPKWASFIITYAYSEYYNHSVLFWVMGYLSVGEVFRVLRILKLAKNFTGLKVLILTVRASLQEMALLLFIVVTGSVMFAVCIYFSEFEIEDQFPDMAVGSYWALITMTSVGYGDMYPQTHWGRFVGVLCALAGIFCTGLPIPIIANNFDLYYSYARIHKAMKEREKERALRLKNKMKQDGQLVLNTAKALVTLGRLSTKVGEDDMFKKPPLCTPRNPDTQDPNAPFDNIRPKTKQFIINAIRRKRFSITMKRKALENRESKDSLAISIPGTDITDISSGYSTQNPSRRSSASTPGGSRNSNRIEPAERQHTRSGLGKNKKLSSANSEQRLTSAPKVYQVQVEPPREEKDRYRFDDLDLL